RARDLAAPAHGRRAGRRPQRRRGRDAGRAAADAAPRRPHDPGGRAQHGSGDDHRGPRAGDRLRPAPVRGRARRGAAASRRDRRVSRRGAQMSALLSAQGLELAYGEAAVCRDVAFEIGEGEIVTLLGANGAGKSTTLRAVAGALIPRAGTIRLRGDDITRLPSHARTSLGIALVPEGRRVFPYLTVRENLELGAFKHRGDAAKVRGLIDK